MITKEYLDTLIQKDKEKGLFRCKREMFTNKCSAQIKSTTWQ